MANERAIRHGMRAEMPSRSVDGHIAALAGRQYGVVTREQLLELGLGRAAIGHRVACARLHRLHAGVFAVGHRGLRREGWWLAAVLAAGPGAVLSHRSAAALWGIWDDRATVDVTVERRCRRPWIDAHRTTLPEDEVTLERGIPVTTPARTLLDLAEQLAAHRLERAVHEAEYRRLTSPLSLDALLTRHQGRRGTAALKAIVERGKIGATMTKSELEARFLSMLDRHDLPRPLVNHRIGRYEVDAIWPAQRLIVELDGRQAHATISAFERDRAREPPSPGRRLPGHPHHLPPAPRRRTDHRGATPGAARG
ncbi:MAG TPA: hypothetical protein VHF51_05015 [Solirubrobacteraceae bacterium]|nr:hypothetical protein [Solirubrobacteraceae bacterium]